MFRSKTRIEQLQAFNYFNNSHALSKRGRETKFAAYCMIRLEVFQGLRNLPAKNQISGFPLCKQNLAKNLHPTLDPSHLKKKTLSYPFCVYKR